MLRPFKAAMRNAIRILSRITTDAYVIDDGASVWSPLAQIRAFLVRSILTSKIIIRSICCDPTGGCSSSSRIFKAGSTVLTSLAIAFSHRSVPVSASIAHARATSMGPGTSIPNFSFLRRIARRLTAFRIRSRFRRV